MAQKPLKKQNPFRGMKTKSEFMGLRTQSTINRLEPKLARLAYQGPTQLENDRANEMSNGNNVKSTSGEKILGILIPLVGLRKTHS